MANDYFCFCYLNLNALRTIWMPQKFAWRPIFLKVFVHILQRTKNIKTVTDLKYNVVTRRNLIGPVLYNVAMYFAGSCCTTFGTYWNKQMLEWIKEYWNCSISMCWFIGFISISEADGMAKTFSNFQESRKIYFRFWMFSALGFIVVPIFRAKIELIFAWSTCLKGL